jgi:hypothetical protein
MAVTIPGPSDGGSWTYEEDFTDAAYSDATNITTANGDFNRVSGSSSIWLYSASADGFENTTGIATYLEYDDGVTDFTDVEIVVLINQTDWTSFGGHVSPGARVTGAGTGYAMRHRDTDDWGLYDFDDATHLDTAATPDPSDNDDVWIRFQAVGSDLRGSAWIDGDSDPGWLIETTDSDQTTGQPLIMTSLLGSSGVATIKAVAIQADPGAGGGDATATPAAIAVATALPAPTPPRGHGRRDKRGPGSGKRIHRANADPPRAHDAA